MKSDKAKSVIMKLRPLLIVIVIIPLVAFMYYPMANMQPRDLHVGIVNLDRGAEFPQGKVNVGEKIVSKITEASGDSGSASSSASSDDSTESPVIWEPFETKQAARKAVRNGDIYAYLVIPSDFSKSQTSTLDALNNLGTALGNVSTGVGKMSTGMTAMSSNLTKLPKAFSNLSEATKNLAAAAGGLDNVSGMISDESASIKSETASASNSQETTNSSISTAQAALTKLQEDMNAGATQETLNADIAAVQTALNNASSAGSETSEHIQGAAANAGKISGQANGLSSGLKGIQTANSGMSTNFASMSDKMSQVGPGVNKMSTALSTIGEGLDTMSENLDSKVGDAVDTMNSTDEDSSSSENSTAESTKLEFYIDQSGNALISTTLASMINGISANTGMQVETTYINELPEGMETMYFIMGFMMVAMFATMMPSILTGLTTRPKGYVTVNSRLRIIGGQLIMCILIAAVVGFAVPRIMQWMCGVEGIDFASMTPYIAIFSLGMVVLTVGAFDLFGMGGVAIPLITMFCGTAVACLPYEYLPEFWQNHIYSWEPLRFLTDGIREIVYRGGSWWNGSTKVFAFMAFMGLVLMLLSFIKSLKKPQNRIEENQEMTSDAVFP